MGTQSSGARGVSWALGGALVLGLLITLSGVVSEARSVAGPYRAEVLRVVDGDTIDVRVELWLDQVLETRIRLAGIDAPELRSSCQAERLLAISARERVEALLFEREVTLRDVSFGKFARRYIARVETSDGHDLAQLLLGEGLAHPYDGRSKRVDWC